MKNRTVHPMEKCSQGVWKIASKPSIMGFTSETPGESCNIKRGIYLCLSEIGILFDNFQCNHPLRLFGIESPEIELF